MGGAGSSGSRAGVRGPLAAEGRGPPPGGLRIGAASCCGCWLPPVCPLSLHALPSQLAAVVELQALLLPPACSLPAALLGREDAGRGAGAVICCLAAGGSDASTALAATGAEAASAW